MKKNIVEEEIKKSVKQQFEYGEIEGRIDFSKYQIAPSAEGKKKRFWESRSFYGILSAAAAFILVAAISIPLMVGGVGRRGSVEYANAPSGGASLNLDENEYNNAPEYVGDNNRADVATNGDSVSLNSLNYTIMSTNGWKDGYIGEAINSFEELTDYIAENEQEYEEYYKRLFHRSPDESPFFTGLKGYDEEFFLSNRLITVFYPLGSSAFKLDLGGVVVEEGSATVMLLIEEPYGLYTTDVLYKEMIIEVPITEDITNVTLSVSEIIRK